MSTISLTTATPAPGSLGKVFAQVAAAWRARRDAFAYAGMSEREFQDIGWGQTGRAHASALDETPADRRARAAAVAAWHGSRQNAA